MNEVQPTYDPDRTRVLVVAGDAGPNPAGSRAWGLAEALAASHDVILALPVVTGLFHGAFTVIYYNSRNLALLARDSDAVVCEAEVAADNPSLLDQGRPVALDLDGLSPQSGLEGPAAQADFFICGSEAERQAWLALLDQAGRVNPRTLAGDESLRQLVDLAAPPAADALDRFCRQPRFAADRGTSFNSLKLPARRKAPFGLRHFLGVARHRLRTGGFLSLFHSAAKRGNQTAVGKKR